MRIYIEQWRPRPAWLELDAEQRAAFVQRVGPDLQEVVEKGAELVALGPADPGTARSGAPQYFAVWRFPSLDLVQVFERRIEDAGWYEYFDQVNLGGEIVDLGAVLGRLVAA
ncbi:hypothetical protein OF117_20995 [Geodermatophilus sp. YIM 151500]|uniref:DUF6616 family protein n=1 Tax=Geodermatophilus sp. YIM 151500 TaxID=2984531 RepID=UPI0021E37C37|nr:DUF6616 family protein [Geodermatophilus sp. YIM 151500]MCV2491829.1 hypothetical protein [Geodermatophilus sp. YIM 151500]